MNCLHIFAYIEVGAMKHNLSNQVLVALFPMIIFLFFACGSTSQVKKPEKYKIFWCGKAEQVGEKVHVDHVIDKFVKTEGDRIYICIDWFDMIPSAPYEIKYEYYDPEGQIQGSGQQNIKPRGSRHRTCEWSFNLEKNRETLASGWWSVKIYVNGAYMASGRVLIADDEKELAALASEKETEKRISQDKVAVEKNSYFMDYAGQKWAVIIGISEYDYTNKGGLENLIYADDDAAAFASTLIRLGWKQSHINLLINKEATEKNIRIALESWLTKAGRHDQIVLFWAGHGFSDPEDPEKVYFVCFDTDITIPATGYRMDRVRAALEEREAKNVIVFVDTCHAGKLITRGKRGISIVPRINKLQSEEIIPKGWIFMVGADTDRKAIEHTSWRNGAFTHCLIKGLSGKADGHLSAGAKDDTVTMGELRSYLNNVMPNETQEVLGVAKRPIITTSTGDPDIWNLTLQAK